MVISLSKNDKNRKTNSNEKDCKVEKLGVKPWICYVKDNLLWNTSCNAGEMLCNNYEIKTTNSHACLIFWNWNRERKKTTHMPWSIDSSLLLA